MSAWSQGWPAPAKLNLMLRITGRRADGYHHLQTVFQFLDIHDTLDFRLRADDAEIHRVDPTPDITQEDDLSVRAARLLQTASGSTQGVDIRLRKCLPIGAGLGGGSSDAATTLVALNALWRCRLDTPRLAELGLQLGADVPVFVQGHAAWAEGVGEQLCAIELPEVVYLVLKPACTISTGIIFNDKELTRHASPITIRDFLDGTTDNDCLPVVSKRYPRVAQALDWLSEYAEARLTGTGACVFAEFPDSATAQSVLRMMPPDMAGWVAQGKNRSALLDRLKITET